MKAKASVIAQKLLNLYRQAHVISGGWAAVNQVFINEATNDVLAELADLPTGKMLIAHIENLRSGKTKPNSIARELLPYGGMMIQETTVSMEMQPDEMRELLFAINHFRADQDGIDEFLATPVVKKFGSKWIVDIRNTLIDHPDEAKKFDNIVKIWTAYGVWANAKEIVNNPINDRVRAQIQVDMPDYENYLPMFGDDGQKLLDRLHDFTSSLPAPRDPEDILPSV